MARCDGTLVVHEHGTPIWCSEELAARSCADHTFEGHRAFISCRVALRLGCPDCVDDELVGTGAVARARVGIV